MRSRTASSSISMLGNSVVSSGITLTGKPYVSVGDTILNTQVKELQTQIMDRFLFPLMRRDVDDVYRNFYLLPGIKSRIAILKDSSPELDYYSTLMTFIEDSYSVYKTLNNYQKKTGQDRGFGNFIVNTVTVTLKPEYHLYNLIIGKPPKTVPYNDDIVNYILDLLTRVNLTYNEIFVMVRRRFGLPETGDLS